MDRTTAGTSTVVVGVTHHQDDLVLRSAVRVAHLLGARLVYAHVDEARRVTETHGDGTVSSVLIDPERPDNGPDQFPEDLERRVRGALDGTNISDWASYQLAGRPAVALARLAEALRADLVVVGTRRHGARGAIAEFVDGSVSDHLAHHQRIPVLTVPRDASGDIALHREHDGDPL